MTRAEDFGFPPETFFCPPDPDSTGRKQTKHRLLAPLFFMAVLGLLRERLIFPEFLKNRGLGRLSLYLSFSVFFLLWYGLGLVSGGNGHDYSFRFI